MTTHDDVVVLAATRTPVEESLVRDWVRREVEPHHGTVRVVTLPAIAAPPREFTELGASLTDEDTLLVPAHVVRLLNST